MVISYELINGNGMAREYHDNNALKFEGEFIYGKKMELEKSIILKVT